MNEKTVSELFASPGRVRVLKFFLNNPEETFSVSTLATKTRLPAAECRRHLSYLIRTNLVLPHAQKAKPKKEARRSK
jgi:hypothetical protein